MNLQNRLKKRLLFNFSLILIAVTYYLIFNKFHIGIPCLFNKLTNLLCPGCGITRCFFAIFEGEFQKAFNYNQLVFILLPAFIVYYLYNEFAYICNFKKIQIPKFITYILLFITIMFGILRNI